MLFKTITLFFIIKFHYGTKIHTDTKKITTHINSAYKQIYKKEKA